jgi:hypothetical protein
MHRSGVVSLISLLFAEKNSEKRIYRRTPLSFWYGLLQNNSKIFSDIRLLFAVADVNNGRIA